jgi:signal transduction histidine kinase
MAFKFKARVLLELGAELISSDPIALYELVKNSLDAGATEVRILVSIALQHSAFAQFKDVAESQIALQDKGRQPTVSVHELVQQAVASLEFDVIQSLRDRFIRLFGSPGSYLEFVECLERAYHGANSIVIQDNGSGMSRVGLASSFLTVGTPERLTPKTDVVSMALSGTSRLQFTKTDTRVPLGEKGIGRLSVMRLGHDIDVQTKTKGESDWHLLQMDWRPAFADPTLDADDDALQFHPRSEPCSQGERDWSGTSITVRDLQSDWSREKLQGIARMHLSKLADPFARQRANKFLSVSFQEGPVVVPTLDREPLNYQDAEVDAKLRYDQNDEPTLSVHINYLTLAKERHLELTGDALRACVREELGRKKANVPRLLVDAEVVARAIGQLGPFELKFHWFNRGRIQRKNRELYDTLIKGFLEQWAGGLLIYRDGFRVYPYGDRSDDWLDLDKRALASSAYKLNRAQIVGYLRLSSIANPSLQDQTNREGFRDSPEKEALRRLLRYVIAGATRQFLDSVDKTAELPISEVKQSVDEQIGTSKNSAVESLRRIKIAAPSESSNIANVLRAFDEVTEAWERAKLRIDSYDREIEAYIHLAGVGLMLEFIAHELSRVTQDTLKAVASGKMSATAVEAQLKTLEKRVRILDELSIPGRQIRKPSSIYQIATLLVEFHQTKADRVGVQLVLLPETEEVAWEEKVERGQILQILDNLISNSFYWLENRFDKSKRGRVEVAIDPHARQVRVSDNGPGIPAERREMIFEQFFTTKPPREGRGLGLYIARRLAEENGAVLRLAEPGADGVCRQFILAF